MRLAHRVLTVDLQILDHEASVEYKNTIVNKWNASFQLVPPELHKKMSGTGDTNFQESLPVNPSWGGPSLLTVSMGLTTPASRADAQPATVSSPQSKDVSLGILQRAI